MTQQGFTLIEMAIVLAVVGFLVGGGILAIGPILEQSRLSQTQSTMDQVENALVVFAARNNRLPCPADGSLSNTSANYGLEQPSAPTSGSANVCTVAIANSVIPWRSLGIDETYSVDGWSHRLSYVASGGQTGTGWDNLTTPGSAFSGSNLLGCLARNTSPASTATTSSRQTLCDPSGSTAGLTPSYPYGNYIAVYATSASGPNYGKELTVANSGTVTVANAGQFGGRAAYVLISHGKSGVYGWTKNGTQIADPVGYTAKKFNSTGTAGASSGNFGFVQGTEILPATSANFFDDILRWRSPAVIIQLCGSGACGNP